MELCQDRRGKQIDLSFLDSERVTLRYHLPLSEITSTFYDRLKEISSGYATFDYEEAENYEETDLVKLTILLNGKPVEPLSALVHRSKAESFAKEFTAKLKKHIERQLFAVAVQALVGGRVIAREDIPALRKDVLAKCYGGDITRKRKLLEKQKEGKKKLKQIGNIHLSQEAFFAILKSR